MYSVRSSAMRFVSVVTSTRLPFAATSRHSAIRSSTCEATGRMMVGGSMRPVGRITCSVKTPPVCSISQGPGVAETKTDCGRIAFHSSKRMGRLSTQEGRRKPYSASVDLRR